MALTMQTMTDEQRKSAVIEYLKAFDNGGVTGPGRQGRLPVHCRVSREQLCQVERCVRIGITRADHFMSRRTTIPDIASAMRLTGHGTV